MKGDPLCNLRHAAFFGGAPPIWTVSWGGLCLEIMLGTGLVWGWRWALFALWGWALDHGALVRAFGRDPWWDDRLLHHLQAALRADHPSR
jgi:hypothetical protein